MGSSPEPAHPLEVLYHVRDGLREATTSQLRADLTKQDLPSYGWTLQSILDNLMELTRVLAGQIDDLDRERLYRGTLGDHPYEVIDHAVDQLRALQRTLAVATRDVATYRSDALHVHRNVRDQER
ncbi:hypothetical protein [Saccharopolyspora sp. CA-218241]|uniref:hypothetical protein n=1 Tax=Saccharopolyspora sp. CA-218241 TaxID=3240027 RepID=UPI003D96BF93